MGEEEVMLQATSKDGLCAVRCIATTIIAEAGEILMDYFQSGKYEILEKTGVDFTTQVDKETDAFIVQLLRERFSSAMILSEEATPSNIDFAPYRNAEYCWVVDPLDGTTNFSRGDKNFSVSIGLLNKGKPILGLVYIPSEKDLYSAQYDQDGAFLNGKRIRVSQTSELKKMVVACDWSWDLEARQAMVEIVKKVSPGVRQVRSLGSACADLCATAEGKIDAYIHTGLKPWDVAAAGLICQKAGANVTTVNGRWWNNPFEETIFVSNSRTTEHVLAGLMSNPNNR